ncbi:motility quorum-sensing regulator / GCU-specific mRNA interferase toxin [Pseudomonas frederiksbergensis]|jgi:motility quorum-sensing regulator/GCU-specific mRNA interferase toxin|uniref:Motility quorum-sensing regulator / GCU-specific mRNA interferase toxin n=1 Tax=Pseudomonas frederiksbergensis TaxID=104087 RepID=A0A1H5J4W0_9PSED|nr:MULTISPECIES: type II toxin-antitoxin system MqsR family toxin [Pseudomonas]APV40922.1 motility quorum-sensing regulator MqsR [Pseudomonas frederiksbergensis]PMU07606.1 type II toxin-antitoxin system MqsR family toxin [Pseudomonas sp. FW305-20]PMU14439.1 type II toxin-antitoxin system MqsR family toxin [Pseudomonas sp. FW305-122]PMU42308.1 type II toxin-antitoxin system MqsR family toxin [Pseudomonas sp. FW305-47B]PMX62835.1 type II toxin-antitoxin system MqsR family toxin [Pseudomonas sp. 
MEKNTPHYDLAVIKADVRRLGGKAFTSSAKNGGRVLGLNLVEMQEVIFELQGKMLYKSMTTYDDHRVWQDVYHINSYGLEIYIKVTYRPGGGPPVISFKEKSQ